MKLIIGKYEGTIYPEENGYTGAIELVPTARGRSACSSRRARAGPSPSPSPGSGAPNAVLPILVLVALGLVIGDLPAAIRQG